MAETIISQLDRVFNKPLELNRQVNFISDRDAISALKRWQGMPVFVISEQKTYTLKTGILNTDWVESEAASLAGYTQQGGYTGTSQSIVDSIEKLVGSVENISITHIANLNYYVIADPYKINSNYYSAAPTTVTLTVGNATNPRIDVIYADVNGLIGVLAGTPSATPVKPIVSNTQRELTFRTVPALATVDPLVTNELVFNENVGLVGGEFAVDGWNLTALNFNSTAVAFSGTKSIYFNGVDASFNVDFKNDVNIPIVGLSTFYFRVYVTEILDVNASFFFHCLDTSFVANGSNITVKDGIFGFDRNVLNVWQLISIPISAFNLTVTEIKGIRFMVSTIKKPKMYLDTLNFQSNVTQPTSDLSPYELLSNKKIDVETNKTSNIFYAGIKSIYDWAVAKFAPASGSANYIQTSPATAQTASQWITGIIKTNSSFWSGNGADRAGNSKFLITDTRNNATSPHGFSDSSYVSPSAVVGYNSYDARPELIGAVNYDHAVAFQSIINYNATGNIINLYGLFNRHTNSNSGVITNSYGAFLGAPSGTGVITNNYGIVVEKGGGNSGFGIAAPIVAVEIQDGRAVSMPATSGTTPSVGTLLRMAKQGVTSAVLDFGNASGAGQWIQSTDFTNFSIHYPLLLNPNGGIVVAGDIMKATKFESTVATGTSPITVISTTLNANLNADLLDGQHGSYYAPATGSSSYIQNQNASAQTGNIWVNQIVRANDYFRTGVDSTMFIGVGGAISGSYTSTDLIAYNTGGNSYLLAAGAVGLKIAATTGAATFTSSVQVGDNTAAASASNVGAQRYRVSGNNSYVDVCMQTGAATYAWINTMQNNW